MDYNEAFDAHRTHTKHAMKTMRDGIRLVGLLYLPLSPRAWGGVGDDRGERERERERKNEENAGRGRKWAMDFVYFNGKSNHYV